MNIKNIKKEDLVVAKCGDFIKTHNATYMITSVVEKTTAGYNTDLSFTAVNMTRDAVIYGKFTSSKEVFDYFLNESIANGTQKPVLIDGSKVELRIEE